MPAPVMHIKAELQNDKTKIITMLCTDGSYRIEVYSGEGKARKCETYDGDPHDPVKGELHKVKLEGG